MASPAWWWANHDLVAVAFVTAEAGPNAGGKSRASAGEELIDGVRAATETAGNVSRAGGARAIELHDDAPGFLRQRGETFLECGHPVIAVIEFRNIPRGDD